MSHSVRAAPNRRAHATGDLRRGSKERQKEGEGRGEGGGEGGGEGVV